MFTTKPFNNIAKDPAIINTNFYQRGGRATAKHFGLQGISKLEKDGLVKAIIWAVPFSSGGNLEPTQEKLACPKASAARRRSNSDALS